MTNSHVLSFILASGAKASLVLALAGFITVAWRSASAAARHLVWTVAVLAALALPAIGSIIERVNAPRIEIAAWDATELEVPPAEPSMTSAAPISEPAISQVIPSAEPVVSISGEPGDAVNRRPTPIEWRSLLFPLWIAGCLISLLPLATSRMRVRSIARRSRRIVDGHWISVMRSTPSIARFVGRVRVLEDEHCRMPMTWGVMRPTLLVPSGTHEWPEWRRREILLHELAHVDRKDCLTQLAAQIMCAVYWFNPLAWMASYRMRVERELACDDRVITAGARATDYASSLLEVARSLRAPALTSSSAIAMARPSQLTSRLLAVLDTKRNRRAMNGRAVSAFSAGAVVLAVSVASLTTAAAATVKMENPVSLESTEPSLAPSTASAFLLPTPAIVRAAQLPAISVVTSNEAVNRTLEAFAGVTPELPFHATDPCWTDTGAMKNVSISNNDDDGRKSYKVKYSGGDCSLELTAEGEFTLRADLADLESISSGGWVRIEERDGRSSKRIEMRRGSGGNIDHEYWIDGNRAAFDANARAWLATTLLSVERRTAFAAKTRVPQLYRNGGVNNVLSEISRMSGAYPRSRYYTTLLDISGSLDANTLNTIVRQASADLSSSDYYMAEVLSMFGKQSAANETTWRTFAEAAGNMKSDYYKTEVLKSVLAKGRLSQPTVGILLRSASGIKSDYYLSDLLKSVASRYAMDSDTRPFYVDAVRHIKSDYYRGELLKAMGTSGDWDSQTSAFVLESAAAIKSDYYKAESLSALVKDKHVADWASFFAATASIGSDYYKKETLTTVLREAQLDRSIVTGVLNTATKIKSDSQMADVLTAVARTYRIDESLRPVFEKAVDSMDSDYYRGAALSALRRSMSRG